MKKVIAIFFLFSFLSANTAFGEVLKLPLLIQHYIEHNQDDNSHSVLDFLTMHYGEGDNHHHNDHEHEHDHLPFKTANVHSAQVVDFLPLVFDFPNQLVENKLKKPILQKQVYSNVYLNSIWQPPKVS